MDKAEKEFLQDTIDILIDYDGFRTVEGLKGLIDEVRGRLIRLEYSDIVLDDVFKFALSDKVKKEIHSEKEQYRYIDSVFTATRTYDKENWFIITVGDKQVDTYSSMDISSQFNSGNWILINDDLNT